MAIFAALLGFSACDTATGISVRRIEINGDHAKYVGQRLVQDLTNRGVHVSESAEKSPVLTGTSTVKELQNGVKVFTLELTDGGSLRVKETVSTQDLSALSYGLLVPR